MDTQELVNLKFDSEDHVFYTDSSGVIWIKASPVAAKLGYARPEVAVVQNVDPDLRAKISTGVGAASWFVNEPGFYQLCFSSNTPDAKRLQRWVFGTVLPNIRNHGYYINEDKFTTEQVEKLKKAFDEITKLSEELVNDLEAEYRKKIETLLYGSMDAHGRQRKSRTFSQIVKALYNMGFSNYDATRMRLALKYYNDSTEAIEGFKQPISLTNTASGYDKIKLMECIYQSMRYDCNLEDSDESMNMILFYEEFGIKAGIPTYPGFKAPDTTHERIKKVAKLKSKVS